MNENARYYWKRQLHRIRIEVEKLHEAVSVERRQECFDAMQAIDSSLSALRASIRENMENKGGQK